MDEENDTAPSTVEAERLQMISEAVKEFEAMLSPENPPDETLNLNELLKKPGTDKLESVITRQTQMDIPRFLYHEWNQIAGQPQQPAGERDSAILNIYDFVEGKLDCCTEIQQDPEHRQLACDINNPTYKLIVWSAELWFFKQLGKIKDVHIKAWISNEGTEKLFKKYFEPINGDARFTVLTKRNALHHLSQLIEASSIKDKLKNFLENWRSVVKLTANQQMSKEMADTCGELSEKFYIIPSPTNTWKMYGMHFYLTNHFEEDKEGKFILDENGEKCYNPDAQRFVIKEARRIREALNRCNFALRGPKKDEFNPESGTFEKLEPWLKAELRRIKKKCSMLLISFSLHGIQGHIMDTKTNTKHSEEYRRIEEILRWIHNDAELKELMKIPKVVVIEACQAIPEAQREEKAEFDKISESLKAFVANTSHMQLLMSAEQGKEYEPDCVDSGLGKQYEPTYIDSYLLRFAGAIDNPPAGKPRAVQTSHTVGHKEDDVKAKATQMVSAGKNKDVLLCHRSIEQDEDGESSDSSNSADDGSGLIDVSEGEDAGAEDEDEVVG